MTSGGRGKKGRKGGRERKKTNRNSRVFRDIFKNWERKSSDPNVTN